MLCPSGVGLIRHSYLIKTLERQHFRAVRITFGCSPDMPTVDVLAAVKLNTLAHLYKCSLIKVFYKGRNGMLSHKLIVYGLSRSSSRLKHGLIQETMIQIMVSWLIAHSFASKDVPSFICYRGAVLWNAIGRLN